VVDNGAVQGLAARNLFHLDRVEANALAPPAEMEWCLSVGMNCEVTGHVDMLCVVGKLDEDLAVAVINQFDV
jgi:hypothetical protein